MASQKNAPLPDGLEIGGYRILRKISSGGFSIVYLADDRAADRFVIKEFLPSTLVKRAAGELVPTIATENLEIYRNGLKCFFEEGRALARIMHPNVVRVVNFFRANETVYMVMAYEQGRSLQEVIRRSRGQPDAGVIAEHHLRPVFDQVINGLREVHANRLLHLDLKPANIYLRSDGTPILLDFGAARQTLTQDAPKLFPMYTPGFAAPELYRKAQKLGPWTDIYGLGASLYACMKGVPPQQADERPLDDKVTGNLIELEGLYSRHLVDIVAWCLRLNPLERPQSLFALQRALRSGNQFADGAGDAKPSGLPRWLDTLAMRLTGRRRDDDFAMPPKD
jgi:serine/threonine protein kinase